MGPGQGGRCWTQNDCCPALAFHPNSQCTVRWVGDSAAPPRSTGFLPMPNSDPTVTECVFSAGPVLSSWEPGTKMCLTGV